MVKSGQNLLVWLACIACAYYSCAGMGAEPPQAAKQYRSIVIREARTILGLNAPIAVIFGQLHAESNWQPDARSPAGAIGIAQFMSQTAVWIAQQYPELGPPEPLSPAWGIAAAIRYDAYLYARIPAVDECEEFAATLSSYNGGLGNLYRAQQMAANAGADPLRWFDSVELFNPGRSPANYQENRNYPRKIIMTLQPLYSGWGRTICL